jgi:hypothetical protein
MHFDQIGLYLLNYNRRHTAETFFLLAFDMSSQSHKSPTLCISCNEDEEVWKIFFLSLSLFFYFKTP